jgi:translation initiation factor 2 beta subunit (eIF-2beta)/eIF-5
MKNRKLSIVYVIESFIKYIECHKTCKKCESAYSCLSCEIDRIYLLEENKCVCRDKYYELENKCIGKNIIKILF